MITPQRSLGHIWDTSNGVPGLLKHTGSGRYYSRYQVDGKRTIVALKTSTWSVAKLRHQDKMAQAERQRQVRRRLAEGEGLMGDLLKRLQEDYSADTSLAASSKTGMKNSVDRIQRCWRACFGKDLRLLRADQITEADARRFANYLHSEAKWKRHASEALKTGYGAVTINKTIELLHRVLRLAVKTGALISLPFELDPVEGGSIRKHEKKKKIRLPSTIKMQELFAQMRLVPENLPDTQPHFIEYIVSRSNESADLAEFMAYSGARLKEATAFVWEDDRKDSIIVRGTKSRGSEDREVPKISALRDLLERMRARREAEGRELNGPAFNVGQCRQAMETACKKVGIERLTHHSLRHFFATVCIEAGVDIPTISRWLGHSDGGILAMQTYGHLRTEHSFAAAAKVKLPVFSVN